LGELKHAVEDFGGTAEPLQGLSISSLRAAGHPVILHVRRPGKNTQFLHWVLFLGMEDDKVRIVDPPGGAESLSSADLLSLWDGVGLAVGKTQIDAAPMVWSAWAEQATIFLLALAGLAACRVLLWRRLRSQMAPGRPAYLAVLGRWALTIAGIVTFAAALGVAWHLLNGNGFFFHRAALAQIIAQHFTPSLASLSAEQVDRLLGRSDVTLIDARFQEDYDRGHLEGAINLPVVASLFERERALAPLARTNTIVVYCQSARCPYAEMVGSEIFFRGFRNVVLYPGGWEEWRQHGRSSARR
jgi:rhodanese-related sulfurtransferase